MKIKSFSNSKKKVIFQKETKEMTVVDLSMKY